jgi:hypothetical protein
MTRSFPPARWRALEGAAVDRCPARTLNRLGKHERGIDRTTAAALANPAQAFLLSPLAGCESLVLAIIRWSRTFRQGHCRFVVGTGAPAFSWPIPKRGMGGASG